MRLVCIFNFNANLKLNEKLGLYYRSVRFLDSKEVKHCLVYIHEHVCCTSFKNSKQIEAYWLLCTAPNGFFSIFFLFSVFIFGTLTTNLV